MLAVPGTAYAAPGRPAPKPDDHETRRLADVQRQVEDLYRKAEAATDAYNLASERLSRQEKVVGKIVDAAGKTQTELAALKERAGAMARAQYRGGGMPPELRLLLGDGGPERFLDDLALARKGQQATRGLLDRLSRTKTTLDRYAKSATREWQRLDQSRGRKAAARKDIEQRLKRAKELESKLKAEERERLRKLEEEKERQAQARWLGSGVLKDLGAKASEAGRRAVEFATGQIGKDYVWGAEGPRTYDCSGLTLRAWQAAGITIPRTSQEQWRQLPKVPVSDVRPGDLIIYFSDASHVGMYVGDGRIVHAPRPGRQVTLAGAGSMQILGAVRPDAR
ncbi:NlpC/P60 family protein [Streptomyces sp. B1866]|uniref:C40 family peptidase n=1 Tax=Streptomyces sp. B1866 TaxID=3075431 RepID=UPI002890ADC8|nr:NlpC/P60 family protein [Streptomyces sp. B1866]MDT3397241.1 NlpC/P60 family protein [Streptomyces sp. B1866]